MASLKVSMDVKGLKEMDQALGRLGLAFKTAKVNDALLDAAEPVRKEMGRLMPRSDTAKGTTGKGHAADHFAKVLRANGEVDVGPEADFWYVSFSEFGTPHQPAKAPMRTAADTKFDEAVRVFVKSMARSVRENAR